MSELSLEIPGADGAGQGFFVTPTQGGGPWTGVVFLTDIFGIRPANQGMAQRVADRGYAVLLPNIFYRTNALPIMDFAFTPGEPRSMAMLKSLQGALNAEQMTRDGVAYADYLLSREEVKGSKVAVVGYCFTGKQALMTAAAAPDKIAAAASFHGGGLVTDTPDSPHSVIPKVKCELYFGHAVEDQSMPPQAIEKLDDTLKGWGGVYQSEVYEGAKHGWTVPGHAGAYNEVQSERHYVKLFDLLDRALR